METIQKIWTITQGSKNGIITVVSLFPPGTEAFQGYCDMLDMYAGMLDSALTYELRCSEAIKE